MGFKLVWLTAAYRLLMRLLFGLLLVAAPLNTSAGQYSAHQIQALYLFNFASFVRWPAEAFDRPTSPFVYCVFGRSNQVANDLLTLIKGERVGGREMELRVIHSVSDIDQCQVLMAVGKESDKRAIRRVYPYLLTVSDHKGFAVRGGMLELVQVGKRIRPVINVDQLQSAKLTASSKLLRFSKQVYNR